MTNAGRRRTARCFLAMPLMAAGIGCSSMAIADDAARLSFDEMYASRGVLGLEFAPKTKALAGHDVQILGYLAPPLKPDVPFFVLTRAPVALCPFCNSDADWPADIVVVYPRKGIQWAQDGTPVAVSGTLEVGSKIDAQTGFVSQVRVVSAEVRTLR